MSTPGSSHLPNTRLQGRPCRAQFAESSPTTAISSHALRGLPAYGLWMNCIHQELKSAWESPAYARHGLPACLCWPLLCQNLMSSGCCLCLVSLEGKQSLRSGGRAEMALLLQQQYYSRLACGIASVTVVLRLHSRNTHPGCLGQRPPRPSRQLARACGKLPSRCSLLRSCGSLRGINRALCFLSFFFPSLLEICPPWLSTMDIPDRYKYSPGTARGIPSGSSK